MAELRYRNRARLLRAALLALLTAVSVSCAYYNTFYLARKYYMRATDGQPYEVDRENASQRSNYNKSADYSKKVLGVHPNSKWVDDAWLMWARTFIGTDDPLKAVAMLEEFQTRFPNSDLRADAEFFLALGYRAARRHEAAVDHFNNFLAQAPKHELVPYAHYERSKALLSLRRYQEAALASGQVLERYPKHVLADRALRQRAEARYQQRDWRGAREDYQLMGERAFNDEERLRYLMREVDCLESARELDEARAVLRDARSHVTAPPPVPAALRAGPSATGTAQAQVVSAQALAPGQDHFGKLTLRMGGVELLDGNVPEAVRLFASVIQDYPRSALAAEAQFRIGFAYETGVEDFARARAEYARVKEQAGAGTFAQQAQQRTENLDRLERFRTASGSDSLQRQAEARFLIAEHFLFNLDRPERAVQEYKDIADSSTDSAVVARALTAQGWVLSRKLNQQAAGDSLFWKVVREYPATQGQLASRDYLEAGGQTVDESLIVAPAYAAAPLFEAELTQAPSHIIRPGQARPSTPGVSGPRASAVSDSIRLTFEMRDSLNARALRDTTEAGRAHVDSLRRELNDPDTTGRAAMLAEFARSRTPAPMSTNPTYDPQAGPAPTTSGAAPAAGAALVTGGAAAGGTTGSSPLTSGASPGTQSSGAVSGAGGSGASTVGPAGSSSAGAAAAGTAGVTGAAAARSTPTATDSSAALSSSAPAGAVVHGPELPPTASVVHGPALPDSSAAISSQVAPADTLAKPVTPTSADTSRAGGVSPSGAVATGATAGVAGAAGGATTGATGAAGAGGVASGTGAAGTRSAPSATTPSTTTTTTVPSPAAAAAAKPTKPTKPVPDPNRPFVTPRRPTKAYTDSVKRVRAQEDSIKKAEKQAKADAKSAAKAAADSAKRNR